MAASPRFLNHWTTLDRVPSSAHQIALSPTWDVRRAAIEIAQRHPLIADACRPSQLELWHRDARLFDGTILAEIDLTGAPITIMCPPSAIISDDPPIVAHAPRAEPAAVVKEQKVKARRKHVPMRRVGEAVGGGRVKGARPAKSAKSKGGAPRCPYK